MTETKKRAKKRGSIILEVAVLFLIGIVATGFLTYFMETRVAGDTVKRQKELHATKVAAETKLAVTEYPAYGWLIRYWYAHSDEMEIEYDAVNSSQSITAAKCRTFSQRHPDLELKYMENWQCEELPEEDQLLYAEITYSWLITRIDQIKQANDIDFLFCVISEDPYDRQFFLFSGADPGAERGTVYGQVYPLGHTVTVAESQTEAMDYAVRKDSFLAEAGDYVDYYEYMWSFDGRAVLIGLTYDLSDLKKDIGALTFTGARSVIINQIALSVICLALLFAFVLRPLKKVQNSIREYEHTKESSKVITDLAGIRSKDEIGRLAQGVSDMVAEIDSHIDRIQTITAEKERISTELALATQLQADMLPNIYPAFPERSEFDIYATMDPAKEVGGDFYDFFLVDDDHLCMVIADVSGKGVPAALFMMASKIILANNAMMSKSPARILTETNAAICSNNREQMFVTVWLGILEISTGKLTAANAGHEYPAIKQPGGKFELLKDRHGLVIGGMSGVKYREYELKLEPGAKLFLYTDGVPEATDASNALFGTDRMVDALNVDTDASPSGVLANVRAAVDGFVKDAEQFDDLTMLCLEYKGKDA